MYRLILIERIRSERSFKTQKSIQQPTFPVIFPFLFQISFHLPNFIELSRFQSVKGFSLTYRKPLTAAPFWSGRGLNKSDIARPTMALPYGRIRLWPFHRVWPIGVWQIHLLWAGSLTKGASATSFFSTKPVFMPLPPYDQAGQILCRYGKKWHG